MIGTVDFEFEFVPSKNPSRTMSFKDNEGLLYEIDNKDLFEHLLYKWNDRESDVIDSMQYVTGLKFRRSVPTKVYEQQQEMDRTAVGELRVPAYMGGHIQTFLMPKYRFLGEQIHQLFHALYDQNNDVVGDFIQNYADHNRLHKTTGDHIYVHAGVREVAASVFGNEARRVVEGQEFWRHADKDSPAMKLSHYYIDSTALAVDSGAKMKEMREHVSGSKGA
jgi:hypothetical protein